MKEVILRYIDDSREFAKDFAKTLKIPQIITFTGNLGSGKTTIIRELIRSLNKTQENIISPSFNILQIYETKEYEIYHYDLYRIKNSNELYELDFEYAFDNCLTIIEWPEKIIPFINKDFINIKITVETDHTRTLEIENRKYHV